MWAKKARWVIFSVILRALHGEMDLVPTEAFVDVVTSLHKAFLACSVFCLSRSKKIQLHSAIGLQLAEDDACLFILIMRLIDAVEESLYGLYDNARVVGSTSQFERVLDIILRQIGTVSVGSEKDRHSTA